jgi:hypothetical protein
MRLTCPPERLDGLPIPAVPLNLDCRDEIIPILRALQQVYGDAQARRELLTLVGKDINPTTSRRHGRRGLNYWEITVIAAVRLGCNLDYDKLQDLAENHRRLQQIMGIGDWEVEEVDFDARRLEDNVIKLRPETLKMLNDLIVRVGHALAPTAIAAVRGDTFVVETNIHYPSESTVIGDGLRTILPLAARLAAQHSVDDWRQHKHLARKVRRLVQQIGRVARTKGQGTARVQPGYRDLLTLAAEVLGRARRLLQVLEVVGDQPGRPLAELRNTPAPAAAGPRLAHYVALTEAVCDTARRRVLDGETVANADKVFSVFEPHTELIIRGKQPQDIQFGHSTLVIEDAAGFVIDYQVLADGVLDQDVVVPVMGKLQKRFGGKIQSASFDRAFHTPENQEKLAAIVGTPCLAAKGAEQGRKQQQQGSVAFRRARQRHPGVESAIGALQAGNGLKRCRDRSKRGYERYVGLGILGRNLHMLGKLLLAREQADCRAAKSKRKRVG